MRYLLILIRSLTSVTKLGSLYFRYHFVKRSAIKHFADELTAIGLPADATQLLTERYAQMLPLNPKDYRAFWSGKN